MHQKHYGFYPSEERKLVKRLITIFVIGIIVLGSWFIFFKSDKCGDDECFLNHMTECDRATYINEDEEASWGYKITGKIKDTCRVEVTLLNAKEGPLGIDEIEGYMMNCNYPLGVADFPENNLDFCTGLLKEEIQGIIIQDLHKYILGNLGEINQGAFGI